MTTRRTPLRAGPHSGHSNRRRLAAKVNVWVYGGIGVQGSLGEKSTNSEGVAEFEVDYL